MCACVHGHTHTCGHTHTSTHKKLWYVLLLEISHRLENFGNNTCLEPNKLDLPNKLITIRTTRALVKNTDSQPSSENSDFPVWGEF